MPTCLLRHSMGLESADCEWFDAIGDRIVHTHLNLRNDDNEGIMLHRNPERIRSCVKALRECGYTGDHSLEFTQGIRTEGENLEDLYSCAKQDLAFLRKIFAEFPLS